MINSSSYLGTFWAKTNCVNQEAKANRRKRMESGRSIVKKLVLRTSRILFRAEGPQKNVWTLSLPLKSTLNQGAPTLNQKEILGIAWRANRLRGWMRKSATEPMINPDSFQRRERKMAESSTNQSRIACLKPKKKNGERKRNSIFCGFASLKLCTIIGVLFANIRDFNPIQEDPLKYMNPLA